jgi:hypothetical protein
MPSYFSQPSAEPLLTSSARVSAAAASPAQERASGALAESAPLHWEVESPSAKVAEPDKFRCSGVPFRQGMSLRLEPHFKFIIGAEDSEDLRLRLGLCVGKRRGSIHSLR